MAAAIHGAPYASQSARIESADRSVELLGRDRSLLHELVENLNQVFSGSFE